MNAFRSQPKIQAGSVLLEGLISILLFSVGILAIVGLQGASIKMSGDAQYRSDASLLANQLIGQMWASDRTPATLVGNFASPTGSNYTNWLNSVNVSLPGVSGVQASQPVVTITPTQTADPTSTIAPSSVVTVTIYWNSPNEPVQAHKYTIVADII
ncbi:MAG: pilus assembly protein PilV [Gallionella sp.]